MNADFFEAVRRVVERRGARHVPGAGLDLKDETAGIDTEELRPVSGLFLTPGPSPSVWTAHWNHVRGADAYELQTNSDPASPWDWSWTATVEALSAVVRLPAGDQRLWIRVRAVNFWQRGPWSDPTVAGNFPQARRSDSGARSEAA